MVENLKFELNSSNYSINESTFLKLESILSKATQMNFEEIRKNEKLKLQEQKLNAIKIAAEASNFSFSRENLLNTFNNEISTLKSQNDSLKETLEISANNLRDTCSEIKRLATIKENLTTTINFLAKYSSAKLLFAELHKNYQKDFYIAQKSLEGKEKEIFNERGEIFNGICGIFEGLNPILEQIIEMGEGVEKIEKLHKNVDEIKGYFIDQIYESFGRFKNCKKSDNSIKWLKTNCDLLDRCEKDDKSSRKYLVDWIIDQYLENFEENDIKNCKILNVAEIGKHLAEYSQYLSKYNEKYKEIIPPKWHVDQYLTIKFSELLKNRYIELLNKIKIPPNEFIRCLDLLIMFENETDLYFNKKMDLKISEIIYSKRENFLISIRCDFNEANNAIFDLSFKSLICPENQKLRRIQSVDLILGKIKSNYNSCKSLKNNKLFALICQEYQLAFLTLCKTMRKLTLKHAAQQNGKFDKIVKIDKIGKIDHFGKTSNFDNEQKGKIFNKENFDNDLICLFCLIVDTAVYVNKIIKQIKSIINDKIKIDFNDSIKLFKNLINDSLDLISKTISEKCLFEISSPQNKKWFKNTKFDEPSLFVSKVETIIKKSIFFVKNFLEGQFLLVVKTRFLILFSSDFTSFLCRQEKIGRNTATQILVDVYSLKETILKTIIEEKQTEGRILKEITNSSFSDCEGLLKLLNSEEISLRNFCALFPSGSENLLKSLLKMRSSEESAVNSILKEYRELMM